MAILSQGSKLSYQVGESGSPSDLCLISLTTSKNPVPKVDVTCLSDTGTMQYIPGVLVELGTVNADVYLDCQDLEDLADLIGVGGVHWTVTLGTDGCTLDFDGYLTSLPEIKTGKNNEAITMSLEIQMQTDFEVDAGA